MEYYLFYDFRCSLCWDFKSQNVIECVKAYYKIVEQDRVWGYLLKLYATVRLPENSSKVGIKKKLLFHKKIRYWCPMSCLKCEYDFDVIMNVCFGLKDLKSN